MGAPDLFNQTSHQLLDSRTKYFGLYAQDTYKARPDLTINYGLRWDVSQPFYDTQRQNPDLRARRAVEDLSGFAQGLRFPGRSRRAAHTGAHAVQPVCSTAWESPTRREPPTELAGKIFGGPGKTSIRVGGGIYYTAIEDQSLFVEVGDAPFGLFYVSPVPVYLEEPYKNRTTPPSPVGNRFPFTIPPAGATGIWPIYLPVSGSPTFRPNNKLPYAEHFNLDDSARDCQDCRVFDRLRGIARPPSVFPDRGESRQRVQVPGSRRAADSFGQECGPFGEDSIYNLSDGSVVNGTRPFSVTSGRELANGQLDFSSNSWEATVANSNYNSLQTSLEKKVGDLRFLAAYTWSKSLDNSSGFGDPINPFNPNNSRALSMFDITHNFVISYGYELPFARSAHGVKGKLLAGWTISGITRFATGFPITLTESDDASLCGCNGVDVPNYNGQPIHFLDPRDSRETSSSILLHVLPEIIGVPGTCEPALLSRSRI